MGVHLSLPYGFIDDFAKEKTENIWGSTNLQKCPYPSFWPPPCQESLKSNADLRFGRIFQFPVLSPYLLQDEKFMSIIPKIDFSKVNAPNLRVIEMLALSGPYGGVPWDDSIQKNDIRLMAQSFSFANAWPNQVSDYLNENFTEYLNYFGLSDYKQGHKYFDKRLPYLPDHYVIAAYMLIMLKIRMHFQNDNAPFLEWKDKSSIILVDPLGMPSRSDFVKSIPEITKKYGNFWLGMNNFLNNTNDVKKFLSKNKPIMDQIILLRGGHQSGLVYTDERFFDRYSARLAFLRIWKYNVNGKHFNFPLFEQFPGDPQFGAFCQPFIVNHYMSLYLELMYRNLDEILPGIWDTGLGVLDPVLPPTKIQPINDEYLGEDFEWYKKEWALTAEYAFFNKNRTQWPPTRFGVIPQPGTAFQLIYDFISTYPPPRLKVPPFSFEEWKRKTDGWNAVFDEQWRAYFKWARHNAYAQEKLNWVVPGQQMKNIEGELLYYKDEKGETQPLLNTFPDYGIMDLDENYGKGIKYLLPWVAAADWIWGDNFWDFVNGAVRKLFQLVIDALVALYNILGGIFPFILLGLGLLGGYLVFGGGGGGQGRREDHQVNQT